MTVIEFFDRSVIKNVANALFCNPERVITVGHDIRPIRESFEYLRPLIEKREKEIELIAMNADRSNVREIIEVLERIVGQYDDCVFDLTGGEDLYLVAVGAIMATHKVQCHYFDFNEKKLIDCDDDGEVCAVESFNVSVDDIIALHGGKTVDNPYDRYYQEPWVLDDELHRDVEEMWEASRMANGQFNPSAWNMTMTCIGKACAKMTDPDSLSVSFKLRDIDASTSARSGRYLFCHDIMKNLNARGIIEFYSLRSDTVSFRFSNRSVKRIMTKAGQLLELRVAFALAAINEEGHRAFHDIRIGVVIDWDPESGRDTEENRSVNEVDIIAMYGAIPVFISCKNGSFDSEELYKFNTVADLFGREIVKKVLITSDMEQACTDPDTLRERMDEMGIKRIEQAHEKREAALSRLLRGLSGIGA